MICIPRCLIVVLVKKSRGDFLISLSAVILGRSVGVVAYRSFLINIVQLEIIDCAVTAIDHKIFVYFCSSCHIADTISAYVVWATRRNQDCVEVAETHRTVVLENGPFFLVLSWEFISELHISFWNVRSNSQFVSFSYFSLFSCLKNHSPFKFLGVRLLHLRILLNFLVNYFLWLIITPSSLLPRIIMLFLTHACHHFRSDVLVFTSKQISGHFSSRLSSLITLCIFFI